MLVQTIEITAEVAVEVEIGSHRIAVVQLSECGLNGAKMDALDLVVICVFSFPFYRFFFMFYLNYKIMNVIANYVKYIFSFFNYVQSYYFI